MAPNHREGPKWPSVRDIRRFAATGVIPLVSLMFDFAVSPCTLRYVNSVMYRVISCQLGVHRPGSLDPGAQPSVIATLDLSTTDFYNRLMLFNVLNGALDRGYLDTMRVSSRGFSFKPITGWYCVFSVVGRPYCCCNLFKTHISNDWSPTVSAREHSTGSDFLWV